MRFKVVKSFRHFVILVPLVMLSACADLGQFAMQAQKIAAGTSVGATVESLPEVCKAVRENKVRAGGQYEGKFVTTKAKVTDISDLAGRYTAVLEPVGMPSIRLIALPPAKSALMSISKGQTVTVSGVISGIDDLRSSTCYIHLETARFESL